MSNPYTPPGSPVGDPPDSHRRSTLGAVVLGFLVDVGGTIVFQIAAAFAFGIVLASSGVAPPEIASAIEQSLGFRLFSMVGGMGFTVLGAYVGARFANHAEYATAFAVGVASLLFGEAMLLTVPNDLPFWQRLLGDLLVIPAALVGGHLRFLQKRPAAPPA